MNVSNINLAEVITTTINTILQSLFSSIDTTLYSVLDDIVFIDESIVQNSFFEKMLGSSNNNILLISNSLLIAFLLYYSVQLFISFYSSKTVERPYQFLFKFLLIAIFMNSSFFFCEKLIFFISTLSLAIRNIGENIFHSNICFSSIIEIFNSISSNTPRIYYIFI